MGQSGGGVLDTSDKALLARPVRGLCAAWCSEGCGSTLLFGQVGGVDGELGCALMVTDEERQFLVVGTDCLVATAEVVVAGGLRSGGALGEGELCGA